ncbi:MAG TPA: signal peptidase I [Streptosporangiaceae bacterium]|nr:signal peptidase I [Streptosporangiaceae bacterium]
MNDDQRMHEDVLTGPDGSGGVPGSDSPGPPAGDVDANAADDEAAAEDQPDEPGGRRWSFLTEMVVLFAVALTIALLIKSFVVQPFFIPSASMENTLLIGDKVLVNKLVYHLRPIARGDIIVFSGSGSWDPPVPPAAAARNPVARVYDDTLGALFHSIAGLFGTAPDQTDYIKRVIGVPGDHVMCCNARGQMEVNGVPLTEKSYIFSGDRASEDPFTVVVPPGRLWVMGDHRGESADSRLHDCQYTDPEVTCYPFDRDGTIPESKVIGRAFMIVWPPGRIRSLPIPSTFDQAKLASAAGHGSSPARAADETLSAAGPVPLKPSAPYLPLGLGFAGAVPLTLTGRWLRLRISRRGKARASAASARPGRR